jgi:hypothetical protein
MPQFSKRTPETTPQSKSLVKRVKGQSLINLIALPHVAQHELLSWDDTIEWSEGLERYLLFSKTKGER